MSLYKEILSNILKRQDINITFPNLHISARDILEMECFIKIEEIIRLFESLGSDGGVRHDFG